MQKKTKQEFPSTGNVILDIILIIFTVALIVGIVAIEAWVAEVVLSVLLPLFIKNPPNVQFVHGLAMVMFLHLIKWSGNKTS